MARKKKVQGFIIEQIPDNLKAIPKLALRLNAEFSDMGFEKVRINSLIGEDTYEQQLTLYLQPKTSGRWSTFVWNNNNSDAFNRFVKSKKGYEDWERLYLLGREDDAEEYLKIEIKERFEDREFTFEIGRWFKKRNVVAFYYPLFKTDLKLLFDNELLFYFLTVLCDFVRENKIKKVNISDILRTMAINKFIDDIRERIREERSNLDVSERNIKEFEDEITKNYRQCIQARQIISVLEPLVEQKKLDLGKCIKDIEDLPIVGKVSLSSAGIKVEYKDMIKIQHEGNVVDMGHYTLTILPNRLMITTDDPIGSTYHHPHISDAGKSICFGEGKGRVHRLLGEFRLKDLVMFVYLFLKSYNPNDKYHDLTYWITRQTERLKALEQKSQTKLTTSQAKTPNDEETEGDEEP